MDELDAYRCAALLIKLHRQQALTQAAIREGELLSSGDQAGAAAWKRMIAAVQVLHRTEPPEGETLQ